MYYCDLSRRAKACRSKVSYTKSPRCSQPSKRNRSLVSTGLWFTRVVIREIFIEAKLIYRCMYTLHSHLRAYIPTRTKLRGKMSVKGREPSASHFPARVIRVNHREREIPHRDVSFRLETIICVYFANFCFLHWKKKLATAAN